MKIITTLLFILGSSFTATAQVKYELVDVVVMRHQPIIKGTMNGKKAYFLLDTGADITLLNKGDAKEYGYSYSPRRNFHGFQISGLGKSTKEILGTYNVELHLGSQRIRESFIAYDLTNIIQSIQATHSVKISGIIGCNVLRKHGFVIDYTLNEVKMKVP